MKALTPIWTTKPETARRLKQRVKVVFDWAKASGYTMREPYASCRCPASNHRGHAVRVCLERNHVRAEQQAGAQFLGARAEKRLQQALRNKDPLAWTDVADAFVQVRDEPGELLPGERFDGHDGAVLHELLVRFPPDDLLDADRPQNFHRPPR